MSPITHDLQVHVNPYDEEQRPPSGGGGGAGGGARLGFTFKAGDAAQEPWAYMATAHPDKAVGYGSTCYVARSGMDLGASNSLKNHSFEVVGFCSGANAEGDANPAAALFDMLTHPVHGMGFPAASIGPLDDYRLYAKEAGLLVSAAFEAQKTGLEAVKGLLECTNSMPVWSDGRLRVLPLGDLPVGEWRPNSTPLYALTCDDFLSGGPDDDPVEVSRRPASDAHNQVKVKFKDRATAYSEGIAEANDLAMQDLHGLRPAPDFSADCIARADAAQTLAQTLLQRHVGVRNEYKFRLGWRYTLLEPGDLVTLTEPGLGLAGTPVRITAVEEDEEGDLTITAEDWPNGIATAVAYPAPPGGGGAPNMAAEPGDCRPPVVFEPPGDLTGGRLQVMIGTSGGPEWGGCEIHASRGDDTYSLVGRIIAPARHGTLTQALAAYPGLNPDAGSTLAVELSGGGGLVGATEADAAAWETLSYVSTPTGYELLSYRAATLTAASRYALKSLRRGLFSTPAAAHAAGQRFMRLDSAVAAIDLERWDVGETIWLKFPSFNRYGLALQDLADVRAVAYKILGAGLTTWAAPTAVTIAVTAKPPA
jgi:hypothetical protein